MRSDRRLGRQPNDPRKPRLRLSRYLTTRPTPPTSADWLSQVKTWGMLGNDQIGDCTAAGAAHTVIAVERYGRGHDVTVADADALAMYETISGYDPRDPNTDVGATLQDALGYWRTTGVAGYKIAAFAQIDPTDLDLVRDCIAVFGSIYCGMNFPASAMDQLDAGQPWTVVRRSAIEGGHCVPIGAYDQSSFTCITWGQPQKMDVAFFQRYFDEAWVPVSLDWLSAVGASPTGLDVATLNADYTALTGEQGPFPQAAPTPTPTPVPPPPGRDADHMLLDAVQLWRTAKGL